KLPLLAEVGDTRFIEGALVRGGVDRRAGARFERLDLAGIDLHDVAHGSPPLGNGFNLRRAERPVGAAPALGWTAVWGMGRSFLVTSRRTRPPARGAVSG